MKNTSTILAGIAVLIALVAVLLVGLNHSSQTLGATTPSAAVTEPAGTVLPNGVVLPNPSTSDYMVARVYMAIQSALGLGDGTSVPVHLQAVRQTLTAATTTPCDLQNPFNATSTIQSVAVNITTGTSTSQQIQIATSSAMNALTSPISTATLAAGAQGSFLAGETASSTGLGVIIPPNGWVNAGSPGSTILTYGGSCSAIFETIN